MPRIGPATFEDPNLEGNFFVPHHPIVRNDSVRIPDVDVNQAWYDEKLNQGAFGRQDVRPDVVLRAFMLSYPFFEDDKDADSEWGPVRCLGRGGYGRVGLWQKRDAANVPIDELAIKESDFEYGDRWMARLEANHEGHPRLLREAVIQRDLNRKDEHIAPHLRRYKFVSLDPADAVGSYRMYMEYCPYGTLERLRRLYRAWDQHLPETFCWYVFWRLASAGEALSGPPPGKTQAYTYIDDDDMIESLFCLHMDLKPLNILLGWEEGRAGADDLPLPKVNDFGLSAYTSAYIADNPRLFFDDGTRSYKTTEQTQYGVAWPIPPSGAELRMYDANHRRLDSTRAKQAQRAAQDVKATREMWFDHSMNIYGFGHIMYSLLTLLSDYHLHENRAKTVKTFHKYGNHQLPRVETEQQGVYGARLLQLVHRCLDPDPTNRPTQLELLEATYRGYRSAKRAVQKQHRTKRERASNTAAGTSSSRPEEKVYYRGHTINDMPQGSAGFKATVHEIHELALDRFVDPELPRLKMPPAKYGKFKKFFPKPQNWWRTLYSSGNPNNLWFKPVH